MLWQNSVVRKSAWISAEHSIFCCSCLNLVKLQYMDMLSCCVKLFCLDKNISCRKLRLSIMRDHSSSSVEKLTRTHFNQTHWAWNRIRILDFFSCDKTNFSIPFYSLVFDSNFASNLFARNAVCTLMLDRCRTVKKIYTMTNTILYPFSRRGQSCGKQNNCRTRNSKRFSKAKQKTKTRKKAFYNLSTCKCFTFKIQWLAMFQYTASLSATPSLRLPRFLSSLFICECVCLRSGTGWHYSSVCE